MTCRPSEAEAVFRRLIGPHVAAGQVRIIGGYYPIAAQLDDDGNRLKAIRFGPVEGSAAPLLVLARMTIDASDWGEVIRLSGAAYEFGPDLKSKYNEPNAPVDRDRFPLSGMNPTTYCFVIEETDQLAPIPEPRRFDDRKYFLTTSVTQDDYRKLGWPHPRHRPFNPPWIPKQQAGTF